MANNVPIYLKLTQLELPEGASFVFYNGSDQDAAILTLKNTIGKLIFCDDLLMYADRFPSLDPTDV